MRQKARAGLGQADPVLVTLEQAHAELVFQLADPATQRWLRDMQHFGRLRDAPSLGDGHEVAHLRETHGR